MLYLVTYGTNRVHVEAPQAYQAIKKARPLMEQKLGRRVFDRDLVAVGAAEAALAGLKIQTKAGGGG